MRKQETASHRPTISRPLLVELLVAVLYAFCHAPEHASEELSGHPEINRQGLWKDALERLRMAATPKPDRHQDDTGFALAYF